MSTQPPQVLIVGRSPAVQRLVALALADAGVQTIMAFDAREAPAVAASPDLVVVDFDERSADGDGELSTLRTCFRAPFLVLASDGAPGDRADGGSAMVLAKPFVPEELAFRVERLLHPDASSLERRGVVRLPNNVTADLGRRLAHLAGERLRLSTTEWRLLQALADRAGKGPVRSRELLTAVWGADYAAEDKFLSLWVARLREALGDPDGTSVVGDPATGYRIVTDVVAEISEAS